MSAYVCLCVGPVQASTLMTVVAVCGDIALSVSLSVCVYVCLCVSVCRSSTSQYSSDSRGSLWSGELTRSTSGFGYSEKQVTIALDSAAGVNKVETKSVKEVPLWLSHSTVDGGLDQQQLQVESLMQ